MAEFPSGLLVRVIEPDGSDLHHKVVFLNKDTGAVKWRWPGSYWSDDNRGRGDDPGRRPRPRWKATPGGKPPGVFAHLAKDSWRSLIGAPRLAMTASGPGERRRPRARQ